MTLLYNAGMYTEVTEVWDRLRQRAFSSDAFPKSAMNLLFAACLQMGTPEALELAKTVYEQALNAEATVLRKSLGLYACLALKQNDPQVCLFCSN